MNFRGVTVNIKMEFSVPYKQYSDHNCNGIVVYLLAVKLKWDLILEPINSVIIYIIPICSCSLKNNVVVVAELPPQQLVSHVIKQEMMQEVKAVATDFLLDGWLQALHHEQLVDEDNGPILRAEQEGKCPD